MTGINKPPRAYAAELVEAWLTRQQPQPVIDSIPAEFRDLATTQARWSCRLIQYWAMRARKNGIDTIPQKMKPMSIRYWRCR